MLENITVTGNTENEVKKKGRKPTQVNYFDVKEELAEKDQTVQGIIIALEDDLRLRRALLVTQNINFYTYKIHFELEKK